MVCCKIVATANRDTHCTAAQIHARNLLFFSVSIFLDDEIPRKIDYERLGFIIAHSTYIYLFINTALNVKGHRRHERQSYTYLISGHFVPLYQGELCKNRPGKRCGKADTERRRRYDA